MSGNRSPKGAATALRRWITPLSAAVLVLLAAAAVWMAKSPMRPTLPLQAVAIAVNPSSASTCPVLAAQAQGFFLAEGLAVTLQPHANGRDALKQALQGSADLATVSDIPVMLAAMRGEPVVVVANMFKSDRNDGIVGRRDRGIAAPADLKGKRIGISKGTSSQFMLDSFLNRHELTPAETEIIDMHPDALLAALTQGRVDAVAVWQPHLEFLRAQLGANGTVFYSDRIYGASFLLAGSRKRVHDRREEMDKVLRAVIRGAQFCTEQPAAGVALLARPANLDTASLLAFWPLFRFSVSLDQSLLLALEDESRWAISNGLVTRRPIPNFLNHVDMRPMLAIQPSTVTIIH